MSEKRYYIYENKDREKNWILESLVQLVELTGKSYRSLQRVFEKGDTYYYSSGDYSIKRMRFIRDRREQNEGNEENLKRKEYV